MAQESAARAYACRSRADSARTRCGHVMFVTTTPLRACMHAEPGEAVAGVCGWLRQRLHACVRTHPAAMPRRRGMERVGETPIRRVSLGGDGAADSRMSMPAGATMHAAPA